MSEQKIENHGYEVDVQQFLNMMTKSLYKSDDAFMRECLCNASDSVNKLTADYMQLKDQGCDLMLLDDNTRKITVIPNKKDMTLTIKDNGIGMTKADLIAFLGKIASSGSKKWKRDHEKECIEEVGNVIGQFGVGFYSGFLVANKITVITKHPLSTPLKWVSEGIKNYTIESVEVPDLKHGTTVILHLKQEKYAEESLCEKIIKEKCSALLCPISMIKTKKKSKKETKDGEEVKEGDDNVEAKDGEKTEEVKEGENVETPKTEDETKEEVVEEELVEEIIVKNDKPIWSKKKSDCTVEELKAFYKKLTNDYDDYLACETFTYEGAFDLHFLVYIPKKNRASVFEVPTEKAKNVHIYASNVFVTNDLDRDIVPDFLNCCYCVVSSNNFPINVSRDFIQGNSAFKMIKNILPKNVLKLIKNLKSEDFDTFYKSFGDSIKSAVKNYVSDEKSRDKWASLLKYETNKGSVLTFDKYIEETPESKNIQVLTGLSDVDVKESFLLKGHTKEIVMLMPNPMDSIMLQTLKKYGGRDITLISAETEDLKGTDELADLKKEIEKVLSDKVEKVIVNPSISEEVPALVKTSKWAHSPTMEHIIKSHPGSTDNPMIEMMLKSKKILEINPTNSLIKHLDAIRAKSSSQARGLILFVYNTSLLSCNYKIDNLPQYASSAFETICKLIDANGDISLTAPEMPVIENEAESKSEAAAEVVDGDACDVEEIKDL